MAAAKAKPKPVLVAQTKGKGFYANVVRVSGDKHSVTLADGAGKRVSEGLSRKSALDAYQEFVAKKLKLGK